MVKNSAAGLLTSLDDLFSTQEEREAAAQPRVEDIPVDLIDDFPNHPFKVRMDGAMVRLVESVGQYGVLEPCLIRPKSDGRYEMIATIQKRGISLLLVLVLMLGMIPSVSAAEIDTQPSTEPAETTTPVTEETLAAETSPPEATQPDEISPPETTAPEQTVPTEPVPEETEPEKETEPVEDTPSKETEEDPAPDEELSLSLMSMDDGIATIADTEIVGAPNAFGNVFLLNGGIDIPSFDHVQHKEHLPLYSVYLKNQSGYENNYYVAYCIEPGVVLGESGGHTGSSTTVGGMTDGTGALEWLSREQVEAMGIVLLYGQREIARRADDESVRLQKLARHAATQVLIWEIASGWRSATPPYTLYDSTFYDAIVPPLECAVQVWGTKFYLDGIDDAYNEIVAQMELTEPAYEDKLPADDVDVVIRVINCEEFTLPKTGSSATLFLQISRILCIAVCSTMLIASCRKKRRE